MAVLVLALTGFGWDAIAITTAVLSVYGDGDAGKPAYCREGSVGAHFGMPLSASVVVWYSS